MAILTLLFEAPRLIQMFDGAVRGLRDQGHDVRVVPPSAISDALRDTTDILVAPGQMRLEAAAFDAWPRLRAIVSPFTGIEGFDVAGFTQRGILVANGAAEENSTSTAEATILLLLAAWYDLAGTTALIESGEPAPLPPRARMLAGRTVGVIGHGEIGRRVVAQLAGFGVKLLVHSRSGATGLPDCARPADLDTVIAQADIICVCAALNPSTRHILNADRLAAMKPDVLLVNTSRGGLIDEAALARQLAERPEMRAALDVFEVEPLPADSPLRALPNVVLTPHSVSHTRESIAAVGDLLLANVLALAEGRMPPAPVNAEIAEQWLAAAR